MKTNTKATRVTGNTKLTHEGAPAKHISTIAELRRTVCACLLWEDSFYESGESVGKRIGELVAKSNEPDAVAELAIHAREDMKLRHVPLLVVRELVRRGYNVASVLERIVQRPDELTEFLSIYWKDGKQPLAASVKRGLAAAFTKFNEYSLAKYNRDEAIKLRDVLFLVHAKPKNKAQAKVWKRLVEGKLKTPDTWEVALSAGEDKKTTFTRLIKDEKLGALALLRNLRNMTEAKVSDTLVRKALRDCKPDRVLPFRFVSAAKYAPTYEPELEQLMFKCLEGRPKLKGKTVLLVDGSGSMFSVPVSAKSDLERFDAAAALAVLVREVCERVEVIVFSHNVKLLAPRRGFALRDLLYSAAERNSTQTETAKQCADKEGYDRLIIITDEQSHQALSNPKGKGYVINVANYQNGVGYGKWTHIDGWSEACLDFIQESENLDG